MTGLAGDRERCVLQPPVEVAVSGLAPHHPCAVGVGHIGEGGSHRAARRFVLVEQTIEQWRK
ncbi:hypothetical protein ACVWZK_005933 [Bradyrhizobium sp. GM0.4]